MAANTNATLILTIFGFYVVIGVMLGLIGLAAPETGDPPQATATGFLTQIGYFFAGIGYTLSELPGWANTMLFLPLGITVAYIVLSFIRGSS